MLGTYTSGTTLPAVIKDDVLVELAAVSALCNRSRSAGATPNSRRDSPRCCCSAPLAPWCPRGRDEEETTVLVLLLCDCWKIPSCFQSGDENPRERLVVGANVSSESLSRGSLGGTL